MIDSDKHFIGCDRYLIGCDKYLIGCDKYLIDCDKYLIDGDTWLTVIATWLTVIATWLTVIATWLVLFVQVQSRVQKYFIKLARAGLPIPGRIPNVVNYKRKVCLTVYRLVSQKSSSNWPFVAINWFPKNIKKLVYIYYNRCFLWRNLCWVWKNSTTLVFLLSNFQQELKIFYDWPLKYYFCWFRYMIFRL